MKALVSAFFFLVIPGLAGCTGSHQEDGRPAFPGAVVPWAEGLYHEEFNSTGKATALLVEFSLGNSSRMFVNSSVDGTWSSTKGVWILQQLHTFTADGFVEHELGSTMALPSCMNDVPAGTTSLADCSPRENWNEMQGSKYGAILGPGRHTLIATAFGATTAAIRIELWLNFTPSDLRVTEAKTHLYWGTSWPSDPSHQSVQFDLERPAMVGTRGARSGKLLNVDYVGALETREYQAVGREWTVAGRNESVPNTHTLVAAGTWNTTVELNLSPGEANGVLVGIIEWAPTTGNTQ